MEVKKIFIKREINKYKNKVNERDDFFQNIRHRSFTYNKEITKAGKPYKRMYIIQGVVALQPGR